MIAEREGGVSDRGRKKNEKEEAGGRSGADL